VHQSLARQGHARDFEPVQQNNGSWLTCCPAHDDHNPSLIISDGVDKNGEPKPLLYCRAKCAQQAVLEALDELSLWNRCPGTIAIPEAMKSAKAAQPKTLGKGKGGGAAIIAVPDNAPPPPGSHPDLGPVTKRWPYRNGTGEVVSYVCRFDPNPIWEETFKESPKHRQIEKPTTKTFRPQTYWRSEDGVVRWAWVAPKSDIPLYNSDKLAAKPDAKVIVCEGEKAADAAQEIFPECVAVTWYSGAKRVKQAPWGKLAKRKVLIWPDHDEAGSQACQAIINNLKLAGCASIAVLDVKALASIDPLNPDGPKREAPLKWDAADALHEWEDRARLRNEVDKNSNLFEDRVRVELSPDNIGETVDKTRKCYENRDCRYSGGGPHCPRGAALGEVYRRTKPTGFVSSSFGPGGARRDAGKGDLFQAVRQPQQKNEPRPRPGAPAQNDHRSGQAVRLKPTNRRNQHPADPSRWKPAGDPRL
jgi:hypothetical protein